MVLFSDNRFGLQRGLDRLYEYCLHWGLEINADKTKCMVFKNGGRKNRLDNWSLNGKEIETVSEFKYLGFIFSSSGKFKKGLDNLSLRAERALNDMKASTQNFNDLEFNMKISLFDSLVKSVVLYGCEIWGFCEAKKHETFYLKFLKHTLNVKINTPNCFVYRECNVTPLHIIRTLRIIKYWIKIVSLDYFSSLKILYNTVLELNENSATPISPWLADIKKTLFKNGFGYIWLNQQFIDDFDFYSVFKKRLNESFWQENNSNISELSKNRLYRHLDNNSSIYLTNLPNNHIRKSITKLR